MMVRYSEVEKSFNLHEQLNRNVQLNNDAEKAQNQTMDTHTVQIANLTTQLRAALARIAVLEQAQTNA